MHGEVLSDQGGKARGTLEDGKNNLLLMGESKFASFPPTSEPVRGAGHSEREPPQLGLRAELDSTHLHRRALDAFC